MSMTQEDLVLRHLKEHGSITSIEGVQLYGILQMPNRIFNLRQRGHRIETNLVRKKKLDGTTVRYAVFVYKGGPEIVRND